MVFRSLAKLLVAAALATSAVAAQNGPTIIGTSVAANVTVAAGAQYYELLSFPQASYIAVTFADFDLPAGDVVIVRSPDSTTGHIYTGKGRNDDSNFIASYVPGETAIVEYYPSSTTPKSGKNAFRISGFFRGFPAKQDESICGAADNSVPAKCLLDPSTDPQAAQLPLAYKRGQAVARLLIGGSSLCTGWLAGSGGHLITNQHCIETADAAKTIDIEFMAESTGCSVQCKTQLGCKGTIVAKTSTFVTNNEEHDYAVIKLPEGTDLSAYGYLQARASGPTASERIYIPQHPVGWAKRFATVVDGGSNAVIEKTGAVGVCGNNQVFYAADTQGGSSGSPVIAAADNKVVALHHCGSCSNTGVDIRDVIADLKAKSITLPDFEA